MPSEEDAENRLIHRGMLSVLQRSTNNLRKLDMIVQQDFFIKR